MFNVNVACIGKSQGLSRVVSLSNLAKHVLEKLNIIFFFFSFCIIFVKDKY